MPRPHHRCATAGNWGSNHSDARCITGRASSPFHFVLELTSFSMRHVLKHMGPGRSSYNCALCSQQLGRPLPPTCLRDVIWKNVKHFEVACACISADLRGVASVDLLLVDAEAHDDDALATYPFFSHPPTRVVFEPKHMPEARVDALGERLRAAGYECQPVLANRTTTCPRRGGTVVWHSRTVHG